jgi:hypothetical protein
MRIAMIGTGYVGLVSGACIADFGHEVTCVDKDGTKISALNSGEIPIYEPGLKDIVQSNVRQGRLRFTTALSEALKGAHAAFIAVGTPSRRSSTERLVTSVLAFYGQRAFGLGTGKAFPAPSSVLGFRDGVTHNPPLLVVGRLPFQRQNISHLVRGIRSAATRLEHCAPIATRLYLPRSRLCHVGRLIVTAGAGRPFALTTATCVRFVTPNLRMICRT